MKSFIVENIQEHFNEYKKYSTNSTEIIFTFSNIKHHSLIILYYTSY